MLCLNKNGQIQTINPMKIWTNWRVDSGGQPCLLRISSAIPNTIKIPLKMRLKRVQSFNEGNRSMAEVIKNPPQIAEGFL